MVPNQLQSVPLLRLTRFGQWKKDKGTLKVGQCLAEGQFEFGLSNYGPFAVRRLFSSPYFFLIDSSSLIGDRKSVLRFLLHGNLVKPEVYQSVRNLIAYNKFALVTRHISTWMDVYLFILYAHAALVCTNIFCCDCHCKCHYLAIRETILMELNSGTKNLVLVIWMALGGAELLPNGNFK